MSQFLQRWMVTTLAVLVAANVVPGIGYETVGGVLVASLLLGLLNAFVRPLMLIISLPLIVYTLGLFILFINALLLYVVGRVVRTFHVETFGAAFWGGLVISMVSLGVNLLTGRTKGEINWPGRKRFKRRIRIDDGDGPVIDV
ncbi:MAG: phage holin family protein [Verrucomicrobiae bacterium]|nr:phage holin family protein [Verrucomicrobiae bacterium]